MADTLSTLAEMVRFNSLDVNPADITDILNRAPLLSALHAMQSSNGTTHKYNKETTAPVIGFRAVNAGADYTAGISNQVSATLEYLDAKIMEDVAACDAYRNGREAWLDNRTRRQLRQALFAWELQLLSGTVHGDSGGFSGLADDANYDALADAKTINATGTTIGGASSVWMIRSTPDDESLALVGAGDDNLDIDNINFNIGETFESIVSGSNSKSMTALCRQIGGHLGVQVGSKNAVARIVNLTAQTGKGLTDSLLSQCLELFPSAEPPTVIAMARQSLGQLQRSRTTYSPTGMEAPRPTEYEGIPIVATDACILTETLIA
jgi:Major capsid protein GP7